MTANDPDTKPADPESRSAAKAPRWRRIVTAVLIVLSCVLAPLSAIAIWTRNQVLNTDRYVRTVTPLASNPAIQNAVAINVTNTLFDNVDVGKSITDSLPKQADFLEGPINSATRQFVMSTTLRFLHTSQFQDLWKGLNRRAHAQVVNALTGQGKAVTTQNGKIYLDLSEVVLAVKTRLAEAGVGVFQKLPVGKASVKVELGSASGLQSARKVVHLLDQLRIVLPVLVLVFLAVGLLISPNRRRTLVRWGLGFAVALVVLLVLLIFARSIYLNAVSSNTFPRDAAQAAYDILFHYLKLGVRILAGVGLLVAAIAYLAGPGRGAVAIRAFFVRMFRGATAEGGALEKVTAFVARWRVGFRIGGVALALLIILASSPSATSVLVILIVLAVYLLLVEWFIRAARPVPSST